MSEDDNVTSLPFLEVLGGVAGFYFQGEFGGLTFKKRHEDFARGESRYWDRADRLREDKTRGGYS